MEESKVDVLIKQNDKLEEELYVYKKYNTNLNRVECLGCDNFYLSSKEDDTKKYFFGCDYFERCCVCRKLRYCEYCIDKMADIDQCGYACQFYTVCKNRD